MSDYRLEDLIAMQFDMLGDFDDRSIRDFMSVLSASISSELKELSRNLQQIRETVKGQGLAGQMLISSAQEDLAVFGDIDELIGKLTIVGLYSKLEQRLKKICKKVSSNSDNRLTWRQVRECLKKAELKIEDVSGYKTVDELRLCNNAIKHEGKVSDEMVKQYGYQHGPLPDFRKDYDRFANASKKFIKGICDEFSRRHV